LSNRAATALRLFIGVGALLALYYFGKFDVRALEPLLRAPWTIAGAAFLILVALPVAALRWAIILTVLGIGLPVAPLPGLISFAGLRENSFHEKMYAEKSSGSGMKR